MARVSNRGEEVSFLPRHQVATFAAFANVAAPSRAAAQEGKAAWCRRAGLPIGRDRSKTDPFAPGVAKEAGGKASGMGSLLRMMKRITALEVQSRYRAMARPPVTMKCPAMPRKVKIGRRLDCLPSAAPASGPRPPELEDPLSLRAA